MSTASDQPSLFDLIYAAIRQIPEGRVASYGQVAGMVGRCPAQMVGFALAALKGSHEDPPVPWYRVVNAAGRVALREDFDRSLQRSLLEQEGVQFDPDGHIDFQRFGWLGEPRGSR